MIEYPRTFIEFIERFHDEEACRAYLFAVRWEKGFTCPNCSHGEYWVGKGHTYSVCKKCNRKTYAFARTVLQDSKLSAQVWLVAMWLFATQKDGISAKSIQENIGLNSYKSAWSLLHKLRIAMIRSDREKLMGTVEIDETYIGGEHEGGRRGRGSENKKLVVIAVQLEKIKTDKPHDLLRGYRLAKIRAKHIENASKAELHSFITDNIATGSTLYRDDWSGYSNIDEAGYTSKVVKMSEAEDDQEKLPHVHLAISLIDRWILGTYQGSIDEFHLQAYLEEFTFRFNRKTSHKRGWLFYRLVQGAMSTAPHKYEDIVTSVK